MSFIPPLFHENNFVTNFKEKKGRTFQQFSAEQCSRLHFLNDKCLSTVKFSNTVILKTIQYLDRNKARGHCITNEVFHKGFLQ